MTSPGHITRDQLVRRGLAVGAGVASGALLAGGLTSVASSAVAGRDVAVLHFALALEQLQVEFYARGLQSGKLPADWRELARVVGEHEREHVAILRRELSGAARPAPVFELTPSAVAPAQFPRLAVALEDAGVALYNGQVANVSQTALSVVAEIVSVEARHAAWARDLNGEVPAPVPSDAPADPAQAEAQLASIGIRTRG